jgi:hypothetical protein
MSRTIPSGLLPELYKLYTTPIHIVEMYLDPPYTSPSDFFCINNEDITFGGQLYTAIAAKRSSIKSEEGTIIQELNIQLDNIDTEFKNLIASGAFNKKKCVIKIVFDGFLTSSANYIFLYSGYLDAPSGDNRWLNLLIKPFSIFEREYPRRIFEIMCNWTFGDAQCGKVLSNYHADTYIGAGSTAGYIIHANHGAANNYFAPGYLLMTSGELINQVRPVLYSNPTATSLRVAFSKNPVVGESFTLQKLCAKTPTFCKEVFNNYNNFGGFPQVPKSPII